MRGVALRRLRDRLAGELDPVGGDGVGGVAATGSVVPSLAIASSRCGIGPGSGESGSVTTDESRRFQNASSQTPFQFPSPS